MGAPDDSVPLAIARDADAALERVCGARSVRKHFFKACGNGKASYHVHLVLATPFPSPPHAGNFVRSELMPKWQGKLDAVPYARRQCWRLPLCAKVKDPSRPLILMSGQPMTWEIFKDCRIDTGMAPEVLPAVDLQPLPTRCWTTRARFFNTACVSTACTSKTTCGSCLQRSENVRTRGAHHSNHVYAVVDPKLLTWRVKCRNERCLRTYRENAGNIVAACCEAVACPRPHQPGRRVQEPPAWLAQSGLDFWRTDDKKLKRRGRHLNRPRANTGAPQAAQELFLPWCLRARDLW